MATFIVGYKGKNYKVKAKDEKTAVKATISKVKDYSLTKEETDRIDRENQEKGWGFDGEEIQDFIKRHKEAREKGDEHTMELIEYQLTDCNYHTFAKLLNMGEYDRAYNWYKQEYVMYDRKTTKDTKKVFGTRAKDRKIRDFDRRILGQLRAIAEEGESMKDEYQRFLDIYNAYPGYYEWQQLKKEDPRKAELIERQNNTWAEKIKNLVERWNAIVETLPESLREENIYSTHHPHLITLRNYNELEEELRNLEQTRGESIWADDKKTIKDGMMGIRGDIIWNFDGDIISIQHRNGTIEKLPISKFKTLDELNAYMDNIKDKKTVKDTDQYIYKLTSYISFIHDKADQLKEYVKGIDRFKDNANDEIKDILDELVNKVDKACEDVINAEQDAQDKINSITYKE